MRQINHCICYVTHEDSLVGRLADRVLGVHEGRLCERGLTAVARDSHGSRTCVAQAGGLNKERSLDWQPVVADPQGSGFGMAGRRAWPAMLVLGAVVAVLVSLQLEALPHEKQRVVGGLLWLAIFFAGMIAVDRSFAAERENGCWEGLTAYPLSPTAIFVAKLIVNILALAAVQAVLIPLFVMLSDVPLLASPAALCLVAALGNIGIAAVGTLVSAVAVRIGRDNLLVILVLPLVIPGARHGGRSVTTPGGT